MTEIAKSMLNRMRELSAHPKTKASLDQIICGPALNVLKDMDAESVDCCICSPPYWNLRDYGIKEQVGLESTVKEYIDKLLIIFDEIKRVLKPTGNCWVNIGTTFQNKCDSLIPERFAIGMVDKGWIKRRTVIWHKPSCMPASFKDDFTPDFEYVYRFVKQKSYWFKQQFEAYTDPSKFEARARWQNGKKLDKGYSTGYIPISGDKVSNAYKKMLKNPDKGRNKRAVWCINSAQYKGAHFAVFPEKLVELMILAGCPPNGVVLDPFIGSGTTALVARKHDRHYIGIDVNPEYCAIAEKRISEML